MKKSGFTLSELLITLTVIGVVSALVLPAVSGILPDKNKAKVIKYNAMLNNAISEILSDDSVYQPYTSYDSANDTTTTCEGLNCIVYVNDDTDTSKTSFQKLFDDRFKNKFENDGSIWDVNPGDDQDSSTTDDTGIYHIKVQTDGKTPVEYGSNNNKNINTFYFNIDKYGNVKPGDALTEAFLKNYKVLNDRKADLTAAGNSTTTFYVERTN